MPATVVHSVLCRYLQVRNEMLRSPEGRKALLEGVPDVVIEVAEMQHILQARSPTIRM